MHRKTIQRRPSPPIPPAAWCRPVRNERDFEEIEHQWCYDQVTNIAYLTACYQVERLRRWRKN